eukprot:TRINITY_DN13138_c0_g1_i1.p1 TRINITY_DN13138_c0_g1~~TRINITY_DN13138_c0_g1_i1.p1  ORF type:complete len:1073 (-),score=196.31 TRINITY_DN13138_c0_g1_i1:71-3289(-)
MLDNNYNYLETDEFRYSNVLTVKVQSHSTVYTADRNLYTVMRRKSSSGIEDTLDLLTNVDDIKIIQYFPILLNRLMYLLCISDIMNVGSIFQAILYVLHKVDVMSDFKTSDKATNPILVSYMNCHFELPNTETPLHEALISSWTNVINGLCSPVFIGALGISVGEVKQMTLDHFSNFFFTLITKSMIRTVEENPDAPRNERFSPGYAGLLKIFVQTAVQRHVGSSLQLPRTFNKEIAFWFSEMLYFYDRGVIFNLIHVYLSNLATHDLVSTLSLKLDFIEILCDHEFYTPLLCPVPIDIVSPKSMTKQFWKHHLLSVHLTEIIREVYSNKGDVPEDMSIRSMQILNDVIWKHVIDKRYNLSRNLSMISPCYLPILSVALENRFKFKSMKENELILWIIPLMWIFRYAKEFIRQYWFKESSINLLKLMDVISSIVLQSKNTSIFIPVLHQSIDILEDLITDRDPVVWENLLLFQNIVKFYIDLVNLTILSEDMLRVLKSFRIFLLRCSGPIFRSNNSHEILKNIVTCLSNHCVGDDIKVAKLSGCMIYMLVKLSIEEIGNISQIKICLTETMIDLSYNPGVDKLIYVLGSMFWHSVQENELLHNSTDFESFLCKLYRLLNVNIKIEKVIDPELKTELLYQLAVECSASTNLRISLLERLIEFHVQGGNYEEVAQTKLIIAALVGDYLNDKSKWGSIYPDYKFGELNNIAPNVQKEIPINFSESNLPPLFLENGFEKLLQEASEALLSVNFYELVIEIHYILINLFTIMKQFDKVNQLSSLLVNHSKSASTAIDSGGRMFSNYYRVAFYGNLFEEYDGAEYIYKELPMIRLADFSERLIKQFSDTFNTNVELLPNKAKEDLKIEEDKHYIQVVSVEPIPNSNIVFREGNTTFDSTFGLKHFAVEIPFFPDGKFTEDVDKQWKIRRIYETEETFPGTFKRLKIVNETNTTKGPLECAVDLIGERIKLLQQQFDIEPPNAKTLQIVLQGSVMIQVNAGPIAIARYFLGKADEFDEDMIRKLRDNLDAFARQVLLGLRLNTTLVDDSTRPHHEAMIESYNDFCGALSEFGINCLPWA